MSKQYSIKGLADALGAVEVRGDCDALISGVATLTSATPADISFLANVSYTPQLHDTQAGCVVVDAEHADQSPCTAMVTENPKLVFSRIMQMLYPANEYPVGQHASASISGSAHVPDTCSIGPNVVIGDDVVLGDGVVILANTVIGSHCTVGDNTCLRAQVTLYERVSIGSNCLIHSGTVIGSDGFGFANENGKWVKMPQVGGVVIGNEVEIGANTCIDGGAIDPTRIGNGVIMDNLIQIAHNVEIGDYTAMAGKSGVAGSTKIGRYCLVGGGAGITGHIEIADQVHLAACSNVFSDIKEAGAYGSAMTALPMGQWKRVLSRHNKLDDIVKSVKGLERRFELLQNNAS